MRPTIPGVAESSFDVDTFAAAQKLNAHLSSLRERSPSQGRNTVVVVGAGFTGIETRQTSCYYSITTGYKR